MHKCSFKQEFRIIKGKLTLCATALYKNYSLECYRRNEEKIIVRNMLYKPIAGYGVEFPGEKCRSYYSGSYTAVLEDWGRPNWNIHPPIGYQCPDKAEKEMVEKCYPGMKYVLAKADLSYSEILDIIPIWKKNPKVELLLAAGFFKLAFSKSFMNLKPSTQKKYMALLKGMENEDPSLTKLRAISKGFTPNQYEISTHYAFRRKCTLEMAKYVEKTGVNPQEYVDYRNMVSEIGHDLNDDYWAFPSDFKKAHAKALRQVKNVRKQQEEKKAAEIQEKYIKAVKKYVGKIIESNGLKVYVPEFSAEFGKHAKPLHQCLVYADYVGQVARGSKVLVFIQKNGRPYATAEINIIKRKLIVGQFYGDEHLKDYSARPDAVQAFNDWAKKFNIKVAA